MSQKSEKLVSISSYFVDYSYVFGQGITLDCSVNGVRTEGHGM